MIINKQLESSNWQLEAVLFLYLAANYYQKEIFKYIIRNIKLDELQESEPDLYDILCKQDAYEKLSNYLTKERFKLNNRAFYLSIYLDTIKLAEQILTNSQIILSTELMVKMIESNQIELIKYWLKYHAEYDKDIKNNRILLSGMHLEQSLSNKILLSDFFNLMLEKDYSFARIWQTLIYLKFYINYREIFVLFAVRRKVRLMSFLINTQELNFRFKPYLILDVLANDVYDIALLLYREYFLKLTEKNNTKIISYLTTAFMKTGQTEEKWYLYIRVIDRVTLDEATKLTNVIAHRVSNQSKSNIFLVCLNIVRIGWLLVQIMDRLGIMYPVLKNRVLEIRTKIVKIWITYMEDVKTIEEMRYLLLTHDLDYRDALTYICDYEILELLKVPLAAEVAAEFWNSKYNIRGLPFIVSANHNLLFNFNHTRYDLEGQLRFYKKRDLKSIGCHGFQFEVWRNCPKSRYYAEVVSIIGFVILTHTWIITYLNLAKELHNLSGNGGTQDQIDITGLDLYYKALDLTYIGFVFCQLAMQNMFRSIYTGYIKQQMYFYTIENFIDCVIFTLFLNYIILTYRVDLDGTWFEPLGTSAERDIFVEKFLYAGVEEEVAITLWGIALWIRVAYSLRLIPYIGPVIMLFVYLFQYLLGYLVLFGLALVILACCGTLLFKDLNAFDNVDVSLRTLFENTWGAFQFSDAKNGRFGDAIGYIYMVIIAILLIIILSNFLIALFASKYSYFLKNEKAILMQEALKIRHVTEANKTHSSLISGAFPLSGLNWITPPFLFLPRDPRLANEIILHIQFLPIMLILTTLFTAYNLIIWPITYLKLIPHKFALIFKKNTAYTGNTSNRLGSFFLILFFGLLILFLNICVDIFYFIVHMYKKDLERIDESLKHVPDMSMRTYHKLYTYLESHRSPYMGYGKVASDLRDDLEVLQAIRQMLFPHRAILKGSQKQNNAQRIVNEYIIVKKILLNNSIEVFTTKLYPNNVKKISKELRFNKRLLQYTLLDMLRFRKLLLLKSRVFLFTVMYEGMNSTKDGHLTEKKKKVERNIADAFNFINTKRTLAAIGYKPKEKIVSHEDNVQIEEGSDGGYEETMKNFPVVVDQRSLKKGGLLNKHTSKISLKRLYDMSKSRTDRKKSKPLIDPLGMDIADDFRAFNEEPKDIENELEKALKDESIERIPGLGDSENSDDDIDQEYFLEPLTDKKGAKIKETKPGEETGRSYDITPSSEVELTEYEEEEEEEEDEDISIHSENVDPSGEMTRVPRTSLNDLTVKKLQ